MEERAIRPNGKEAEQRLGVMWGMMIMLMMAARNAHHR